MKEAVETDSLPAAQLSRWAGRKPRLGRLVAGGGGEKREVHRRPCGGTDALCSARPPGAKALLGRAGSAPGMRLQRHSIPI